MRDFADTEREQEIVEQACRLRLSTGCPQAPIDVHAVAAHLGLVVEEAWLGLRVSALLVPDTLAPCILVNVDEPRVRQRFSSAHEIYHHLAQDGVLVSRRPRVDLVHPPWVERAADRFAAELLMPTDLLPGDVLRLRDLAALAGLYEVSPPAMNRRVAELGLRRYLT